MPGKAKTEELSAQTNVIDAATKSQTRFKKYRRECRKRSMKQRFCVHKSKLQEELLGMQMEVNDWKTKAGKIQM